MEQIIHIRSIAQAYSYLHAEVPPHPLITLIKRWPKTDLDLTQARFTSDLYLMAMKREINGSFQYGLSSYDFQEGTMIFIGPGQVANFSHAALYADKETPSTGWTILFHPDLIRKSELGKIIHKYSFFSYDTNEALHLSEKERRFLNTLVDTIDEEIHQNMDRHSQELIVQNLETILKYSSRYYDRQFYTRTNLNKDLVSKFEQFLKSYFDSEALMNEGMPTLDQCGEAMNMSGPYLSDLLRTETGRSAKDHIHRYLIEQAKTILLNSTDSVSQVAFSLGFDYPQNFSKLFKSKTGMSPSEYRDLN
ncbi:MAG: helix-turn-helix transcriptional regulator [Bacteroidota bacterium]